MKRNIYSMIIAILLLIALIVINNKMEKRAIEQCVQGGNDYNFCVRTLR